MADRREAQSSSRTEREDKEASSADCDNGGQTSCSTRSIPGARETALRPGRNQWEGPLPLTASPRMCPDGSWEGSFSGVVFVRPAAQITATC